MTTQVLFIRHGETDWNRLKRIQGHVDIPLSAHGVQQAEQLGARLAREGRLDAVYSSDLQRARQTAHPFADALGLEIRLSEGLRERFFGAFQAHDSDEINEKFPAEYIEWQTRDPGFSPPGDGESQRVFYHRVVHAMEPIVAAHAGGRIAVVAHGGVLDCIYRFAMKLPLQEPRNWPLLNCSINIVDYGADGATVVSWGDVAHLSTDTDDDNLRKRA
ncbi:MULTISPECIES: histidine phosphatase family protein [unclassified Caballeronia]|uniref:histidine phosphatase family protein n=1 Tax=unclassified Caballeronia TaxID=2646786 RepID=UPI00285889B5|nr:MULTISPECIES: histidine phosphatase family protein [unclassified Caballeronia]MDR5812360.1 histidine phosphatase family protein [Caballeronia sp. LZ033]MDR5819185.1 histidine phosphatase family protein [Caballeronia sp. LZ043]MDR5876980.1 histidine phosphatase family protein [Caballeronia sp. LZ032]